MLSEVEQFSTLSFQLLFFLHFIINLINLIFFCVSPEWNDLFFYHADLRFRRVLVIMLLLKATWQVWIGLQIVLFSACGCCHVWAFGDHHFLHLTLNSCAKQVRKSYVFHLPFWFICITYMLVCFYPGVVRFIGPIAGDKKRQYVGLHLDSPGKISILL